MAYSYTEKKRIRKDFSKRPAILEVPNLLETQISSYFRFLQVRPADDLKLLASMPTMDEARGQLLAVLEAPATQLVRTLAEPAGQFVRVVAAYGDQQQAA